MAVAEPSLPHPAHGRQAINLLGDQLDEAAALNSWTPSQLRRVLSTDSTAWVDSHGRVYYKDLPATAPAPTEVAEVAPFPLSDTFLLHSNAGSQKTLFIDFDGTTVSGTYWNEPPPDGQGVPAGAYPAWSLDGDAATFNDAEREAIQTIWQRVAEDYAPFDIDVTTEDPGADGIARTDTADLVYGTRALVTPSNTAQSAVCGEPTCGGAAYIDVFGLEDPDGTKLQPAWVFPQSLSNSPKNIAEAVSHEVGHNFSLEHDGRTSPAAGYYAGHNMWAPIMGTGYQRPVVQWSKGEYANASNASQDDVALIAARAPYRADEAGSTPATAIPVSVGAKYITSASDQDVFSLGGCTGNLTADATPAATSPNLDVQLDILNAAGAVLATSNPVSAMSTADVATGMSATAASSRPPEFYFVRVDGVGNGTGATGYTGYGSIGSYSVSIAGTCGLNVPAAPLIGEAKSGKKGNKKTAKFKWSAPTSNGGLALTGYKVRVFKKGKVVKTVSVAAGKTSYRFHSKKGRKYSVVVIALNRLGAGAPSAASTAVKAR